MFFFFNDTATTELYTLSLHDALPISALMLAWIQSALAGRKRSAASSISASRRSSRPDRKSTRLNSSHITISYAVFCLKKKIKYVSKHDNRTQFTVFHRTLYDFHNVLR